ncbi:hypothetical protein CLAFUW4_12789 [Fulvia fulva]|uniref:Uncharacterized protein n=1 Tax=Passalora fulva TaxID=5499 RepID=A0A9Q8PJ49_PASFU|nr:uncharacterized protein CLAFUR5_12656 [Fulvia fulva]KAK4612097.1 hypothetical protein CLAFUR4_12793 [Fulvia fulva]KAK4612448.1 hypothetical protein CLAFUR0_12799 [Fulvia fulva]UJO23371.1 hypothetical protein CLAFUR5_12656 [Fulvia fulva]WPV20873.1 hypothetical protein CLAFUW4_12789 [Fulvia fulva]WPV36441.1 hypothetical protein CLAFUW7_12796 [Fulvia fulva]
MAPINEAKITALHNLRLVDAHEALPAQCEPDRRPPGMVLSCSSTPSPKSKAKFNSLPDELLLTIYNFNATRIFDIADLHRYISGARASKAIYRCALESLCRHFNIPKDIRLRHIPDLFTNIEIFVDTLNLAEPGMRIPSTRTGHDFAAFGMPKEFGLSQLTFLAADGFSVLSKQRFEGLAIDERIVDTRVGTLDLRVVTSDEIEYAWEGIVDGLLVGMPSVAALDIKLEVEKPTWSEIRYPNRLTRKAVRAYQKEGLSVRVTGPRWPEVGTVDKKLSRDFCRVEARLYRFHPAALILAYVSVFLAIWMALCFLSKAMFGHKLSISPSEVRWQGTRTSNTATTTWRLHL